MSMLGKILAVLNVLAAIGFLVIAGMDYSARRNWSYQAFRHELAIGGLPVDDKDDAGRPDGRPVVKDLTETTLKEVFQPAGGDPQPTQVAEVQRVKKKVLTDVDGAGNENEKRVKIAGYLLPLAKTGDERDRYIAAIDPKSAIKQPVPVMQKILEDEIDRAASPSETLADGSSVTRDREERRAAIADLLYNLNPTGDAGEHARVQTVVGLAEYVAAADRQATNLLRMAERVQQAITEEQSAFVRGYRAQYPRLQDLAEQLRGAETRLQEQKGLLAQYNPQLKERQAEVQDFTQRIEAATRTAQADLATLAAVQKQLFDLQRDLATGQAENQKLEVQLRTKELGK
jgi:DNA repair exonuclease SbcCD ATPase subunit